MPACPRSLHVVVDRARGDSGIQHLSRALLPASRVKVGDRAVRCWEEGNGDKSLGVWPGSHIRSSRSACRDLDLVGERESWNNRFCRCAVSLGDPSSWRLASSGSIVWSAAGVGWVKRSARGDTQEKEGNCRNVILTWDPCHENSWRSASVSWNFPWWRMASPLFAATCEKTEGPSARCGLILRDTRSSWPLFGLQECGGA